MTSLDQSDPEISVAPDSCVPRLNKHLTLAEWGGPNARVDGPIARVQL